MIIITLPPHSHNNFVKDEKCSLNENCNHQHSTILKSTSFIHSHHSSPEGLFVNLFFVLYILKITKGYGVQAYIKQAHVKISIYILVFKHFFNA